jgi:lysophospholipase L1-like esterase
MFSLFKKRYTFLALGDSYTIGEGVSVEERWISQVIQKLKHRKLYFKNPQIVAKTGWTSRELIDAFDAKHIFKSIDFVSILIGVNNQYRGESKEKYRGDLMELIGLAIMSAKDKSRVMIISIPDYGITPFAADKNPQKITAEIEEFNAINYKMSKDFGVGYIDITRESREAQYKPDLLTMDQLHPSGKMYAQWADKIANYIESVLKSKQS